MTSYPLLCSQTSIKLKILASISVMFFSCSYFLFSPLGTTWVEAAEGATNPTLAIAGGVNVGSIREQKVRLLRKPSGTRPVANSVSGIGNDTVIKIDIPTTDKSQW